MYPVLLPYARTLPLFILLRRRGLRRFLVSRRRGLRVKPASAARGLQSPAAVVSKLGLRCRGSASMPQ